MSQYKYKQLRNRHKKKKTWPMLLLFGAGLLFVVGAVFMFSKPSGSKAAIEVTGAPSLKVDKEKVDLGDIKLGRTVDVTFQVMNVGDKTLRFSKTPYIEVLEGC